MSHHIHSSNTLFRHCIQLAAALLLVLSSSASAAIKELDSIVVIVNDDVITRTMLDERVTDFRKQLQLSQLARIEPAALRKQVLERMIRDTIQIQQAKQLGIKVDDLTLNRMLERLASSNNLTLEAFRQALESEGLNYARFREQTRDEIMIQQLQQRMVASKVSVSDQEIQQYISLSDSQGNTNASYHLRHILVATPTAAKPADIDAAKKKAESIYQRIQDGEDFSDLAIRFSDGRNALDGGDLGDRKADELPQLFIDAVSDLAPGQSSRPVRSASGFHLLKLVSSSRDTVMVQQLHTRHILLRTSDEFDDDEARAKLLEIKQQIADGKNFAELASEYSEDPGSKTQGGDLGWTSPGDLVPAFENIASSLDIGQVSEPFKTQFGWHILEVLGTREHNQTQSNRENQARAAITKRKTDEELRLWLRRIRDEAYVEFIDD